MAESINEKSSAHYTITLKDEFGNTPALDSLTFWWDDTTGTVTTVNGRAAVNVLVSADFSYDAATGIIAWSLRPNDTQILVQTNTKETRRLTFDAVWNGGNGRRTWKTEYTIVNLNRIV